MVGAADAAPQQRVLTAPVIEQQHQEEGWRMPVWSRLGLVFFRSSGKIRGGISVVY